MVRQIMDLGCRNNTSFLRTMIRLPRLRPLGLPINLGLRHLSLASTENVYSLQFLRGVRILVGDLPSISPAAPPSSPLLLL